MQKRKLKTRSMLLHGIEETDKEKTDQLVLDVINKDMDIDLPISIAIERTHCIGTPKQKKKNQDPSLLNLYATMTGKMFMLIKNV